MNRTASRLTILVALIATLVWARLERSVQEVPSPASTAETPVEAEPRAASLAILASDPDGAIEPEHERSTSAQEETRTEAVTEPPWSQRRLPVRVLTRASHARDAEPVPGMAFQVFAQRSRVGTPASSSFRIPAPAHVPTDRVLHEGRTDATGMAGFEVDAVELVLSEDGLPLLCARVVEPGYQQETWGGRDGHGVVQIQLVAQKGASVRGRVVDEQGAFVEASVRLRRMRLRSTAEGEDVFVFGPSATALAEGWFELHFDQRIDDGWLLAEAGPQGTGALRDLVFDPQHAPTDLRVVVGGPGVLAGRILDGAGEPSAGVDLLVQLAELDRQDDRPAPPATLAVTREPQGGGHLVQRLQTDARGEFDVRGLRREPYVVRARIGQDAYGSYSELLTPRAVLADGQRLELVLHRPHILVRTLDARGEPLALSEPERRSFLSQSDPWPTEPFVLLQPCAPYGAEPLATADPLLGERVGANEILFEVPDGARYLVGARGGGFDGTLQVIEVPAGANRVTVELRARELGALGSVSVRVVNADRELGRGHDLVLVLESPAERVRLVELAGSLPTPPWVLNAPAGRYRLVVEGKPLIGFQHGTLVTPRALGRIEAEVELRAGQTQELTLTLDDGARLEVTLAGTPDAADLAAVRGDEAWGDPSDRPDPAARVKATLTLEQLGRRPEPLVFAGRAWEGTSAVGTHLLSRWPLGATQRSEVCPSGRYTLVARLPGGREARREVELVAGTTVAVRLEF